MASPLRTILRAKKKRSREKVKAAQRKLAEMLQKKFVGGPKVERADRP